MNRGPFFILLIFIAGTLAGFFGRTLTFALFQFPRSKAYTQYLYDEPLRTATLGGATPQETFNLYLDALIKEDINTAIQYWWPYNRDSIKDKLARLKRVGLLKKYGNDFGRKFTEINNSYFALGKNEKELETGFIYEKNIDLIFAETSQIPSITVASAQLDWAKSDKDYKYGSTSLVFRLNPYTKKWLIK